MSRTRTRGRTGTRGGTRTRQQVEEQPELEPVPEPERNEDDVPSDEEGEVMDEGQGDPPEPNPGDDPDDDDDDDSDEDSDEEDDDDDAHVGEDLPGALTPGQAMRGTLDYKKKSHLYLYRNAIQALDEELYDLTPDQFFQFMKSLDTRANAQGWTHPQGGILWVPAKGGNLINLIDSYGSISLARIQRHEKTYWDNGYRPAQDDRMLFECLMNSLSKTGKERLIAHSDDYMLKRGNRVFPSGLSLLKVIVRESYLDSNATTGMIREQLSNLEMFMPTVNNDITRFNNHVKMLLKALSARSERTLDLLTYLFKAYAVCNDEVFTKYIGDIQNDHDMGTKRVDANELMSLAEKKFKIMKTTNKWEAPSQVDSRIMALEARLDTLKEKLKNKKSKQPDGPKKGKQKQEKGGKKKPDWFNHPPESGKMHEPKEWNGKPWYYCCKETGGKCDGIWRAHKPKECHGGKRKPGNDKGNNNRFKKHKSTPKVELSETILEGGGSASDGDELMGGYFSDE